MRLGAVTGRRSRPVDQRALRPVLGLVLGRRPVPPELPHDRDRVHRRQPRARLLRRLEIHRGSDRGRRARRDHRQRQLPLVGAIDVRVRVRELPRHPAVLHGPPARLERSSQDFFIPGIQGGANSASVLLIIAMVGTTVAPWQLFFQQSNIIDKRITPTLDQLRAPRHVDRRGRRRDRRRGADLRVGVRVPGHPRTSATSPTPARPPPGSSSTSARPPARCSRSCCSTLR